MKIHVQGRSRPGAAVSRPAEQEIRDICTAESFERGKRLHGRGRVLSARISGGAVTASVGDTEACRPKAPLPPGSAECGCTCGYGGKGACEHVAAALLYASENFDSLAGGRAARQAGVKSILKGASREDLRGFLDLAMKRDKDLRNRFLAYFLDDTNRNYREEMDREYTRSCERGDYYAKVDMRPFFETARIKEKRGGYAEALRIYKAISETMDANMEKLDDSGERYSNYFVKAVRGMIGCINAQDLEHAEKREHISYLLERTIKCSVDYFDYHYGEALKGICSGRQDLLYWKGLLEPILPERVRGSEDYESSKLVNMYLYTLEGLDDPSREEICRKNYRADMEVCLRYVEYLKGPDPGRALQVAEEGMRLFPCSETRDAAVWLYGEGDSRRLALLEGLFCETREWRYYDALLESAEDRRRTRESVLGRLRSLGNFGALVDVLLREGDYDRAVSEVASAGSLELLESYHETLCGRYPGEYHAAYRSMLGEADPGRDSQDYRKFGDHLRKMKSVPRYEREFREFVDSIREEFPRRPSLLAELDSI